jgi:hypothetical protein
VNLGLLIGLETKVLNFAWSWLVILGTAGTIGLALALSAVAPAGRPRVAGSETVTGS